LPNSFFVRIYVIQINFNLNFC